MKPLLLFVLLLSCNRPVPKPQAYVPPLDTLVILDSSAYYFDSTRYYFTKQMSFFHMSDSCDNKYHRTGDQRLKVKGDQYRDSGYKYFLLLNKRLPDPYTDSTEYYKSLALSYLNKQLSFQAKSQQLSFKYVETKDARYRKQSQAFTDSAHKYYNLLEGLKSKLK